MNMMDLKIKKFLVDNREVIEQELVSASVTAAVGLVTAAAKVVFNIHDVERKVVVRDNPDEDFIELEDLSWENEIRDIVHDPEKRKAALAAYGIGGKDKKKKKKKKDKDSIGGGAIKWD